MIVLGFDPGGSGSFGVAMVNFKQKTYATELKSSVDSALEWVDEKIQGQTPAAAGIDTCLFWEGMEGGDRKVDRLLRQRYKSVERSILKTNSLFGAMAIQGVLLARRMKLKWPELHLNETHPKVYFYARSGKKAHWGEQGELKWTAAHSCKKDMYDWLRTQGDDLEIKVASLATEHEFDALLGALITYRGLTGANELENLYSRTNSEEDAGFPAGPCSYYWPKAAP